MVDTREVSKELTIALEAPMKLFVLAETPDFILDKLRSGDFYTAEDAGDAISKACTWYLGVLYTVTVDKPFPTEFDLVINEAEIEDFEEHSQERQDFADWRSIYDTQLAIDAEAEYAVVEEYTGV